MRRWRWTCLISAILLTLASTLNANAASAETRTPLPPVPPHFQWGVATAGFQSEGSPPDSNWRRYVDGKNSDIKQPYANAVDFRHRYPGDIARAKAMGLNTFRFSVEWSRVEPRPGVFDERALAYYDDVVQHIIDAGMRPMITLNHWVHPGWVADRGGFTNATNVQAFLNFTQHITSRYAGRHVQWVTFNEPTQYVLQEVRNGGISPVQIPSMLDSIVDAHRRAYDMIHRIDATAQVTSNLSYLPPPLQFPADAAIIHRIADKLDFLGLDYYYGLSLDNISAYHALNGELWKTDPQPDGLYYALKDYHRQFPNLPIYIVENGMSTDNGTPRPDGYTRSDHLRDHIYWMQRAQAEGVPVIGYNYWSITDNYEWGSYRPRFGLYTVDALTDPSLRRRSTGAVSTYRDIAARGGVPAEYTPVRKPAWCSTADLSTCLNPPAQR